MLEYKFKFLKNLIKIDYNKRLNNMFVKKNDI